MGSFPLKSRLYECFKYLHQGIVSSIKRKSLPEIAKVVGINSSQSLHHFLANSPWSVTELKQRRLTLTLKALKEQKITVVIDETGDRKKGNKTDYVARQYLGSVGKIDNGIVSVNAYGAQVFCQLNKSSILSAPSISSQESVTNFTLHQQWSDKKGWKTTLNNFRLIIQPTILFWMIVPWLDIFPNRSLLLGFHKLIAVMNQFYSFFPDE